MYYNMYIIIILLLLPLLDLGLPPEDTAVR